MYRICIESPYAGDTEANTAYARECLRHSLDQGEAPFASHLLYTQVYDDTDPTQRSRGIQAGYEWLQAADRVVFYIDRGWSQGMLKALKVARLWNARIEVRSLQGKSTELPE